jgi:hypothetical protein
MKKKDCMFQLVLGRYLVWRDRTAGSGFQLVKTKPELGLVFGTRFGTGASFSVLSKNQNPVLGFLKGKKIGNKD